METFLLFSVPDLVGLMEDTPRTILLKRLSSLFILFTQPQGMRAAVEEHIIFLEEEAKQIEPTWG